VWPATVRPASHRRTVGFLHRRVAVTEDMGMRWCLCAMVLLVALAACSEPTATAVPVLETTTTPAATSNHTQDRGTPTPSVAESSVGVFDVYLVEQEISPQQMRNINLAEVQLEETPLLSVDDIVAYRWETHEMELSDSASKRLAQLERSVPLGGGLPFVVCAGGEPVYGGALWTSYSSATYDGIVIDVHPAGLGEPVSVRLGYPTPEWFTGEDLRSDPRIYRALEEAGKLK
jgi:hypothetical protein